MPHRASQTVKNTIDGLIAMVAGTVSVNAIIGTLTGLVGLVGAVLTVILLLYRVRIARREWHNGEAADEE